MNHLNRLMIIIGIFLISTFEVLGQTKVGYVNTNTLLQYIPEMKEANSNLEALQKQLQKQYDEMVQAFQTKYQALQLQEQQGELSRKQLEEEAQSLRLEEEKITTFQQEIQSQILEKRNTLLQPIFDDVNQLIADVAKEQNFSHVIDDSGGILLYKDSTLDLTNAVKEKLETN